MELRRDAEVDVDNVENPVLSSPAPKALELERSDENEDSMVSVRTGGDSTSATVGSCC